MIFSQRQKDFLKGCFGYSLEDIKEGSSSLKMGCSYIFEDVYDYHLEFAESFKEFLENFSFDILLSAIDNNPDMRPDLHDFFYEVFMPYAREARLPVIALAVTRERQREFDKCTWLRELEALPETANQLPLPDLEKQRELCGTYLKCLDSELINFAAEGVFEPDKGFVRAFFADLSVDDWRHSAQTILDERHSHSLGM